MRCANLKEGRFSFRGMNPELERLLELEEEARNAIKREEQPKEVSDKDMMQFYYEQKAPAANQSMARKFQSKKQHKRKNEQRGGSGVHADDDLLQTKKPKFVKPS